MFFRNYVENLLTFKSLLVTVGTATTCCSFEEICISQQVYTLNNMLFVNTVISLNHHFVIFFYIMRSPYNILNLFFLIIKDGTLKRNL